MVHLFFPTTGRPHEPLTDYFLPLTLKSIVTSTLEVELNKLNIPSIDCIKLDTQGTELAILQGLDDNRFDNLLFVEASIFAKST